MHSIIRIIARTPYQNFKHINIAPSYRTFLSQAYYCNEVWDHRLKDSILEKVKVDEFYQDIDLRFSRSGRISAVDVDIFANALTDDSYVDEVLDLAHKLRLSADTGNALDSTSHAVIRYLSRLGRNEDLLNVLDDRLNYGIFLDNYTANVLMDTFYKNKNYVSGARVAGQLMLQENVDHPLSSSFSLLNCYSFLLDPKDWPEQKPPEEPEEEVKVRVKFLRNPYNDDHFDLTEPLKIVGKTLWMNTMEPSDALEKSIHLVGLTLHGKLEQANKFLDSLEKESEKIYLDLVKLLPEDNEIRLKASKLTEESENVQVLLEERVKQAERKVAEKDLAAQCELFAKWIHQRKEVLEKQNERLKTEARLQEIDIIQKDLKTKETKLWFFENEENIELAIEGKKVYYPKKWFGRKKKPRKVDEHYIPPEIRK